jgi:hypothetical protein
MSEKIWSSGKVWAAPVRFFEPPILEEVTVTMVGEEHTIPAVKHPSHDLLVSAIAMIVKLHQRVEALEAELRGEKE